jgi:hypothetical protein
MGLAILYGFFIAVGIFHALNAWRFYPKLQATPVFTPAQKKLHSVLIFLIPFLWIYVLKGMMEPVRGAHNYKRRSGAVGVAGGEYVAGGENDNEYYADGGSGGCGDGEEMAVINVLFLR